MSCNTCQKKFSFFTKDNGCPLCGFSYCHKCLKYQCQLPNGSVKKVCGRCNYKSNSEEKKTSKILKEGTIIMAESQINIAPVDISQKLDSLENPAKPPIVMYKPTNYWDGFKHGLDPVDQEIVDRLRKLKEDKKLPPPSVEEIKRRLALLRDENPDSEKPNVYQVDTRTDEQKTEDLIKEYMEKLKLPSPTEEIQARLKKLQESQNNFSSANKCTEDFEDMDEETVTKKLIEKALAEAALEKEHENEELEDMEVEHHHRQHEDDDEKPSCVMCDETKDLQQCSGCSGDLYCTVCFENNHDDFELTKHKKIPLI